MKLTGVVLRNLFTKPATGKYPMEEKKYFKHTRGHIHITISNCIFCSICAKKCPTKAIAVNKVEKSWTINRLKCIQCSYCTESCPKKCLTMENAYTAPTTKRGEDSFYA